MFENRIGYLAGLGFARMPAARVAADLKALGYNAVEWTSAHFNPRTHSAAELRAVVDASRDAGLAVSEVVIQQDYVCLDDAKREDRIAYTLETIHACAEADVGTVNLFTGPAPWDPRAPRIPDHLSQGAAWDMVLDAFGRIAKILETTQVHAATEPVWGHLCNDYYTLRLLIDHFDSDYLGVNFDPSHDVLKGNFDTGWLVRQWGKKRIKHCHLKDAIGIPEMGKFLFPLLGEGRVDWPGMFTALAEIGYEGYLSVEFESFAYHERVLKGDTREAARISLEQVKALLAL
jgi:sugar phosphate isomerase/epimerase